MSAKERYTKEKMIEIAYELQKALIEALGKKPWRITTNKEFSLLRIGWGAGYERRDWYDAKKVEAIIEEFSQEYNLHIYEITQEEDSRTSIWLTKAENDPERRHEVKHPARVKFKRI